MALRGWPKHFENPCHPLSVVRIKTAPELSCLVDLGAQVPFPHVLAQLVEGAHAIRNRAIQDRPRATALAWFIWEPRCRSRAGQSTLQTSAGQTITQITSSHYHT